jgi:hypothetical protein
LDFRASGRFQYSTGIGYYWLPEEKVNGLGLGWAGLGPPFALLIHDIGGTDGDFNLQLLNLVYLCWLLPFV